MILGSVWLIIIAAIGSDFIVRRAFVRFAQVEEEISLNEEKLLRLTAIVRQAKAVDGEYEKLVSGYRTVIDADNLLQEIETIAMKAGVNILSVKPTANKEEGVSRIFTLKIDAQDDVLAVARFIHALSQGLKGVGVDKLQINAQNREELPKASMIVNAVVFKD